MSRRPGLPLERLLNFAVHTPLITLTFVFSPPVCLPAYFLITKLLGDGRGGRLNNGPSQRSPGDSVAPPYGPRARGAKVGGHFDVGNGKLPERIELFGGQPYRAAATAAVMPPPPPTFLFPISHLDCRQIGHVLPPSFFFFYPPDSQSAASSQKAGTVCYLSPPCAPQRRRPPPPAPSRAPPPSPPPCCVAGDSVVLLQINNQYCINASAEARWSLTGRI